MRRQLRKYLDLYAEQDDEDAENNLLEILRNKQTERGPVLA